MNYEEEIGSRSGRRRQLKVELVSDEDISNNYECHRYPNSDEKCSDKEYLKDIRKVDISSRDNGDGGHEKASSRTTCNYNAVNCSRLESEECIFSKVSNETNRGRWVVCKRYFLLKHSRRKKKNTRLSHVNPSSHLHKYVESIEAIVSKIASNIEKNASTALHKESRGVSGTGKKQKGKMSCSSHFRLFSNRKQIPNILEKHSQISLEKCGIKIDFLAERIPSLYSGESNRIANEIYRRYLRSHLMTKRYSSIIHQIKETIRKFGQPYCSKYPHKKKQSEFDRKYSHSNFKEDLKFILYGLHRVRNEFIYLFPVFGNAKNLDEFVEREIDQSQVSNGQQTPCHSLNLELVRLGSFHNFPSSGSVSTVKLARQGFYYSREENTVICFACGFKKDDWKKEDNVETIHRAASPNCPLLNSSSTSNVQIGGNGGNGFEGNCVSPNERQQGISGSLTNGSNNGSEDSIRHEGISENLRDCLQNHSSNRSPNDPLTKARAQQEKINAFIRDLDPLGINFDRPKYPSYAVVAVRISSFTDWPSSITQTPRDLAMAGFFYAGYGDYTRCFFCGGGLRNWEPGDDPWTEHARWFPKCAFLRQNKGDEFVALVQIEHQEEEALGGMNGHNDEQANDMRNKPKQTQYSPQSVTTNPGFQSLLEMGYSSQAVQRAFDLLKETKESTDIKAEELLEIVFAQEETTGEDILPPSASCGVEDEISRIEKSEVKTDTTKPMESAKMNEGNDFHTNNQRDLNSVSQSFASMSVEETRSLIEENRKLKDLRLCKICLENDASIAMLPCGHLCCCPDCAPAMRKCPICRQFVKGTVKTWLA